MAVITSIVYSPDDGTPVQPETHYHRVPVGEIALIADYGIDGDRKGGNPGRNLNVMTQEIKQALAAEGYQVAPGEMGEQITVSELDLAALDPGTRVRLGDAVIEVIKPRTGCDRFEAIQGLSRMQAQGRMGAMARVITGGLIRVGDPVALVSEPAAQTP